LDHAEGLSLSQFFREWGFVSFKSSSIFLFFFILILFFMNFLLFNYCSAVRCFVFVFRRDVQKLQPEVGTRNNQSDSMIYCNKFHNQSYRSIWF
jgi:hypothetical protein